MGLSRGEAVEGRNIATRGRTDFAYLHQTTGAAIVPVGLIGTLPYAIAVFASTAMRDGAHRQAGMHLPAGVSLEEGTDLIMKEIALLLGGSSALVASRTEKAPLAG